MQDVIALSLVAIVVAVLVWRLLAVLRRSPSHSCGHCRCGEQPAPDERSRPTN